MNKYSYFSLNKRIPYQSSFVQIISLQLLINVAIVLRLEHCWWQVEYTRKWLSRLWGTAI